MRVVGRLTGEQLCKAFYEARTIEDEQNEVVKQVRSKKLREAKIISVICKKQEDIEEKKELKLEQISLF
jgi:hypothetical protein